MRRPAIALLSTLIAVLVIAGGEKFLDAQAPTFGPATISSLGTTTGTGSTVLNTGPTFATDGSAVNFYLASGGAIRSNAVGGAIFFDLGTINIRDGNGGGGGGTLKVPELMSIGTKFTTSGCSVSATTGGASAGTYTSGTTGACTVVITMNGASGSTAPNGWSCWASDRTTPADIQQNTASTTTTATITGTTVSGDVVNFGCLGY